MSIPTFTIDASHTFGSGKNTGIERVVRNLCRELPAVLAQRGIDPPMVATHFNDSLLEIDKPLEDRLRFLAQWEKNAVEFVPSWIQTIPKWLARSSGSAKIRKWMEPHPSHLGIYKVPHHLCRWSTMWRSVLQGRTIAPRNQQILILPDAYWTRRGIWKTVQKHRDAGAMVATIVYDLIPLTHPEYVGPRRSEKFRSYLDQVVRHSDTIIAISKTVRDDVRNYIEVQPSRAELCQDIRSFVLGAEFSNPQSNSTQSWNQDSIRPVIKSLFDAQCEYSPRKHPPYLMVASFDPRKNHSQALDAFDLLWQKHPDLNLCFAGRSGTMCAELMQRIAEHPKLNRGLWVFHDLSDVELHHAYARCSGVLLPSIVEGFGLPIVESLWHGRKTFASDTPIHREVGGKHCEYFALFDPQDLADRIETWERLRASAPHDSIQDNGFAKFTAKRFKPITWRESTEQLVDAVLDAYHTHRHASVQRAA
jgi:alpha-1,2-rhamnosyltransferase